MLVLDTNHIVEFDRASASGKVLRNRLKQASENNEEIATTIICVEEQLRGWLAQIHQLRDAHQQIAGYQRLQGRIDFFARWLVLPWNSASADIFQSLRSQHVRIGTMDLKIASIVLARDAKLLSRNLRDFRQVPNLHVEDWLN